MSGKIFVVTGANKGIGYGIVQGLAQQLNGAIIYLTARNSSLGQEALKKLDTELGARRTNNSVFFHQLDITDETSCRQFAQHLQKEHSGLDVLINNAGFAFKNSATEPAGVQADVTIGINYYGTKLVTDILGPLIRDGGRIVNVCSQAGIMGGRYKKELIDNFAQPNYTVTDIDAFVEEYKKLAHENRRKEGGYPESAYCVSKTAEIALTLIQARQFKSRNIIVNGCCPGYVDTAMTSHKGPLTIEQGADTPIWLATAPDVPCGEFVFKRKVNKWLHDGKMDFS